MKVLIIHAHPEEKLFCSSLKNTAEEYFTNKGDEVMVSDLYAMEFNPIGDRHDFKDLSKVDYFKYQQEQINAFGKDLFVDDIKKEMEKFSLADLVIFNFPLW